MKISIIIPVYNSEDTLDLCLAAIFKSELKDYEVVVVDDASGDASVKIAQKYPCRLIALKENKGAAAVRNIGAGNANGDILVFVDSDVVVYPAALNQLICHLDDPGITGAVGMYSLKNRFGNFLSQYKHMVVCFRDLMTDDVNQDSFKAAFLAIRKEAFLSLPFDENIKRASIEDIEFGRQLIKRGFRFILDKNIQVEHVKRFGLKDYFRNQYQRSCDIAMNYLTQGSQKFYLTKTRKNSYAKAYILRAPLSVAFVFFVLLAVFLKAPLILFGSVVVFISSMMLEYRFLHFVLKERKIIFTLQCVLFYLVDGFISSLGIFRAGLKFCCFRRANV